jgi:hypothetical protein
MRKKRSALRSLEPPIHWPLPAGQNPGDPYYEAPAAAKTVDAPRPIIRPEDCAALLEKLNRFSGQTTDSASFVLERVKWAIEVTIDVGDPSEQAHFELFRDRLAQASSMLKAPDLPKEAQGALLDVALYASFHIGVRKGNLEQALVARRGMPGARIDPAQQEQALIVPNRTKRALELIAENGWSLAESQKATTIGRVAKELGVTGRTVYRWLAARK